MLNLRNGIPPSSPSRRHFIGIAAASARKLAVLSIGTATLTMSNSQDASARREPRRGSGGSGNVRCFTPGTLILTPNGEVPVEKLAVGVEIMTANGPKPVKWIGCQTFSRNRSVAWHPRALPVRVSQFAIDDQTPRRDVCLSQEHSLFIDGALIPVRNLINGRSIRIDEATLAAETFQYFHVELETHEVIYADGMPVESFLYLGGVVAWDNLDEYRQRYGEHRVMSPVAPIHSYNGGFEELRGLIRLATSRVVDVRDPIQIAHDRLAERATLRVA